MNKQIEEISNIERLLRIRKLEIEKQGFDVATIFYGRESEEASIARYLVDEGYRKAKEGEWIDEYKGKYENALYKCSACGGRANIDWVTSNWNLTPFCPHCGAKMKGEKSEQAD